MLESILNQYLLIILAVVVLLGIKYHSIKKSYNNQLSNFVDPSILLPDIKSKLKKSPETDVRIILNQSLIHLQQDHSRIRNVAILIALMKE